MKRIVCLIMTLALVLACAATAEEATVSITTGRPTDKAPTIMVAQLDNQPGARPQKGIASADIVYEIELYKGGSTRYTAVFNDTIPAEIEAIRSARIANATVFADYRGAFVYYGAQVMEGSSAIQFMESGDFEKTVGDSARYNGIWVGSRDTESNTEGANKFYRDGHRVAPHNVVAKLQDLWEMTDWSKIECRSPIKFASAYRVPEGEDVTSFAIDYGSKSYAPSYVWDASLNRYQRLYNNKPFTDGATGEQVYVDNVIVQHVESSWYEGASDRPKIELIGKGVCEYFLGGKHIVGTWERENLRKRTVYYDPDGNKMKFNPGTTFVQIFKDAEGNKLNILG